MKNVSEEFDRRPKDKRGKLAGLTPPVPTPKYSIGESIAFDRNDSDYGKDNEGMLIDTISGIEMYVQDTETRCGTHKRPAFEWRICYYLNAHDDAVPERCVLGPAVIGPKR